ncbi:MAG TPA: hypothetical protein VMX12_02515 [Acidimicrobiia bacterium]|nr:hypothetical protein [Acidimicrobiia bacterium]
MKLEVEINGRRSKVDWWIFRSFTGRRFVNGREFNGPVFFLGTNSVSQRKAT